MAASPPESSLQMILVRAQLGSFQTERERKGSAMNWAEAGAGAGLTLLLALLLFFANLAKLCFVLSHV